MDTFKHRWSRAARLIIAGFLLFSAAPQPGEAAAEAEPPQVVSALGFSPAQPPAALAQPGVKAPGLVKQFEERSHYVRDVDFISADTGWAVGHPYWDQASKTYTSTILKTTNAGVDWETQPAGAAVTLYGVDFVDANNGWAVGENGVILRTSNGGAAWVKQSPPTTDLFYGVAFVDASRGWATSYRPIHQDWMGEDDNWEASIWHTANGGSTWQKQTLPAGASLLFRLKFIDANRGWAAGVKYTGDDAFDDPLHSGMLYRTLNGGQTWQEFYSPGPQITLTSVEWVDENHGWTAGFPHSSAMESGYVFHTANGGLTWERQEPGAIFDPLWDIEFIDANQGYVVGFNYLAAWGPPVYRTRNGGATWEKVRMEEHDSDGLFAVSVKPDRVIIMGDHDFIARSTTPWDSPGGTCYDWDCLFTQAHINPHYLFHDVFFVTSQKGWAAGSKQYSPEMWGQVIFHTTDGGQTWAQQYEKEPAPSLFSFFRLDSLYFVDDQRGWAVGASDNYADAILTTSDGGQTWTEQGRELYTSWDLEFFDVHFLDDQKGWALATDKFPSMNIHLVKTIDGGAHWTWVDTGISGDVATGFGLVMGALDFTDDQHGWVVGGLGTAIATSDGGANWSPQLLCGDNPCYGTVMAVDFIDNLNGWAGGESLFRTADGGEAWQEVNLGMRGDVQAIQFVDSSTGWLATDRGEIFVTGNGGDRWHRLAQSAAFPLRGLHFTGPAQGWFVGESGVIYRFSADQLPIPRLVYLPLLVR